MSLERAIQIWNSPILIDSPYHRKRRLAALSRIRQAANYLDSLSGSVTSNQSKDSLTTAIEQWLSKDR